MILRIATAVGAGIGVLGFVAFFGGIVFFTRFLAAGVPAEEAIAHVPRANLIATGAAFLVPALLTAAGAVTALVLLDSVVGRKDEARRNADEAVDDAKLRLEGREAERAAALARVTQPPPAPQSPSLEDAEGAVVNARAALRDAEKALDRVRHLVRRRIVVAIALLLGEILIVWPALSGLTAGDWLVVGLAAFLTIAASMLVLFKSSFLWFALASFVAVGLFVAISTYERTKNDTKMSPAALLHDTNLPAYGFFVTETSDRVYIAQPQRKLHARALQLSDTGNRLLEFKRDDVTNLEIGPLIRTERAYRRGLEFAVELCAPRTPIQSVSKRSAIKGTTPLPKPVCDPAHLAALRTELGRVRTLDAAARHARHVAHG